MKHLPASEQIAFYQANGFVVIEDFLSPQELQHWRAAVMRAVDERAGKKIPGKEITIGENDGINEDGDYFGKVFDQLLNLWQTNDEVRELMLDERIGKMAAILSVSERIRIWHDQALFKRPWANPTAVAAPMRAGSCSFHNGLTIHGAGPNMTSAWRRAMTCAYMPDGNVFNGEPNILPEAYLSSLKPGDLLNNNDQNPLIYAAN